MLSVQVDLFEAYQNSIVGITFKSLNGVQNFTKNYADYFAKDTLVPFENWGMVSRDLQIAFERIWSSGFTNYMQEMWGKYCDLVLSFSGINFGSCLAQMTAVKFIQDKWWPTTQVFFVGFATPRCGSEDFAYYVDLSLGKNAYRVNWKADPIPQLPATTCTRGGSAQLGRCPNSWYHCCTQYTYTKWAVRSKVTTCTDPEDTKCLTGSTPADFYGYFGSVPNDYDNMSC
ncbi:hypothetical protein WR25_15187 isoform A [Diploscapter pachys]|uniref:Fungal lipase-type domain-containing protein n=1 Tax=Diploscapter pachys TaxID=2018661 RepID=A0A2A2KWU9_9BILA|nr:hypothetical protein WR25_15187 isoform A [Diploscapter pachys]